MQSTGILESWISSSPYTYDVRNLDTVGRVGLYTPAEYTALFADSGEAKARRPAWQILSLAYLAGFFIAMGGVAANTAAHMIGNEGLARLVMGLLFPFGLIMVILTGAELYTGDTLMAITLKEKRITLVRMVYHWILVFAGNAIGAISVAIGMAFFGQLNISGGMLAVFSIKQAAAKSTMDPMNAFVMGIFCNVLVTIGVLMALGAKDVTGKAVAAFVPISFFVIAGFEHSIANLYYVPAGLFASTIDRYRDLAIQAGIDVDIASWGSFVTHNLIPVTLGNTVGGLAVGWLFYWCHMHYSRTHQASERREITS
ncbi:MAG: formate/nitrite transporter family protein [Thermomicrobiales bacterium]|nr:formate/nitrite transporter family protein [Thermomicrobiales bacterium]